MFPIYRPYSSPRPLVCFCKKSFHISKFEVVYPASHILLILFLSLRITQAIISVRKLSNLIFHFCYRLWMYPKPTFSLVLIKAISKVFNFADMRNSGFLPIYFQKKGSFYEWDDIFQGSLRTLSAFAEDHTVSRPREPPPKSLSELYVNLSAHTAPIIQPMAVFQTSSVQTDPCLALLFLLTSIRLFSLNFGSCTFFLPNRPAVY